MVAYIIGSEADDPQIVLSTHLLTILSHLRLPQPQRYQTEVAEEGPLISAHLITSRDNQGSLVIA
eukprot:scaffold306419_cov35-Attheya_sp.AAC.1